MPQARPVSVYSAHLQSQPLPPNKSNNDHANVTLAQNGHVESAALPRKLHRINAEHPKLADPALQLSLE
jgi:hypothetical protein